MYSLSNCDDSSEAKNEEETYSQAETEVDGALKKEPEYQEKKEKFEPLKKNKNDMMYNKRALPISANTYELENFEKNLLIIFNHINVVGYDKPRTGTEEDVKALRNTFKNFGFTVEERTDLTKAEILSELDTLTETDLSDYGCVAVAVLTHGDAGGELKAKDINYDEQDIIERLKVDSNPSLATKPRILLIQACRGHDDLAGIPVHKMLSKTVYQSSKESEKFYTLPVEADMLVIHSSYTGKASHRTFSGSWFIQTFCDKIDSLANAEDLESILIHMKRAIAIDHGVERFNRNKHITETNKQMPVITSTLIRKLYLRKYQ